MTDDQAHWFPIIVAQFKELCRGGKGAVHVLNPKAMKWFEIKEPIIRLPTAAAQSHSGNDIDLSNIRWFSVWSRELPIQGDALSGFYTTAHLEAFAADPVSLVGRLYQKRFREFEVGCLDEVLPQRYLELLERFQNADDRDDCLYGRRGRPIFDGVLDNVLIKLGTQSTAVASS
ncbi:uncharacterized protein DSM5745_00732 [Aspergillus mulundensis]|uniref:Uncharacterized protein n=1 Tax=Aspergillus mulundensis TaxID=1810919 RepID=A0A3D8T4F0_9EURO|nr:hypothetical protein DSM5745_00732 [Aspergillus mulundensis]RDW93410.1 hypothetical protein DSM5745_00732 [Aspergillus mulundensis]